MSLPSFFNVTPPGPPQKQPKPLTERQSNAAEVKERILGQFEMIFPRVIQSVYAGSTVSRAVADLPSCAGFHIDYGMFNRWVRKDATRRALLEEAEEARAEVWADRMISIAEGESSDTIDRDKFKNETYKFLMGRQSKKRYGDTKTIDVTHTISIAAALQQSKQRVIEAMVVDDSLPEDETELKQLVSGEWSVEDDSEDGDDD